MRERNCLIPTMFYFLVVFIVLLIQYTDGKFASSRTSSRYSNRLISQQQKQLLYTQNEIIPSSILSIHRGGATRKNTKKKSGGRTASLSSKSSSASKTATGKRKVTGSVETQQKKAEQQEESAFGSVMQKYKKMLPLTRIYITMVGVSTALGLVLGEELTQTLLSLDPIRAIYGFELWRPFTAACFLGPPSVGWLMNGYYLFQYGSTLEKAYGSAQHLIFLLSQIITLSILSILLGQPFFASSMITAMLHVFRIRMSNG